MNPPIIRIEPLEIIATASLAGTIFMLPSYGALILVTHWSSPGSQSISKFVQVTHGRQDLPKVRLLRRSRFWLAFSFRRGRRRDGNLACRRAHICRMRSDVRPRARAQPLADALEIT
jgi:hypothetical protein